MTKRKFNNKKIKINGITFDSKKEAARYSNLVKLQEKVNYNVLTGEKFDLTTKEGRDTKAYIMQVIEFHR